MCYARQTSAWKLMGAIMRLMGMFMKIPKIPAGGEYLAAALDENDPLFGVIGKLKPTIEIAKVYAKSMDGKLPEFSLFHVVIKDMVL